MSDWDAERYHRVSDPQRDWGLRVLERLQPARGERILDLGCGTGRLTARLQQRAATLRVVGLDRSGAMLREAARQSGGACYVHGDATALPFGPAFDAVFSTATFHWVLDHDRLFREIARVLGSGGRLVAQAGGGANLATLRQRAEDLARAPEFAGYFDGWTAPWFYAGVHETEQRLAAAGFVEARVWLEAAPTAFETPETYAEFVACVCLRRHLDRLPPDAHAPYLRAIVARAASDTPPFTLDYWRLNIDARKL